ncbi:MAG: SAM-dependent methyltransferase [Bacilli bacterium]
MMTFEQWMRDALYHPVKGYYMNDREKIGARGDFMTSPALSSLFGAVIARAVRRKMDELHLPYVILESGAGRFQLFESIAHYWSNEYPDDSLAYVAIETSPYHASTETKQWSNITLQCFQTIEAFWDVCDEFNGVWLSNEFWDALPVHLVSSEQGAWCEWHVKESGEAFVFDRRPLTDCAVSDELERRRYPKVEGHCYEISTATRDVLHAYTKQFGTVYLLHIDYALPDEVRSLRHYAEGTIRGFRAHQLVRNPLAYQYEMDLTSDVSLEGFRDAAVAYGFQQLTWCKQNEWLLNAGIFDWLRSSASTDPFSPAHRMNRQVQQLILGDTMSHAFYVMEGTKKSNDA